MISVIVPAYNEENRIMKTLDALCAFLSAAYPPEEYEILVIDDGSTDKTREVVNSHSGKNLSLLGYGENRGKGAAVKYGVQHAKGDYLVFTDADLPYAPENIEKAVRLMKDESVDVVLGSRKEKDNGRKYPLYRKLMSGGFSLVVNLILNLRVPDTQCGFKAFTKRAAEAIFAKSTLTGWGFDVELIFLAKKKGFLLGRLPVELFHDNEGSKVRALRDAVQMFREVRTVRKNDKKGIYNT
ncbi:MAG: glycosyltransferase family 2 protein [Clostridia bacterium]|nr:glycosyltransferase family 2 protein [Clostridia bacterium]